MTFNWNYMLSLLSDADFWQATWTVIKLSLLTWGCSIVLGFVLALAADSWLARLKSVSAQHLQNETFILPEQISGTLQVAAQGDFAPVLGPQPGGLVAVIALVSLRQGVAVVPESVVGHISLPNVIYRPIEGCEAQSWLSLIYRRFEKSAAVTRYIEQVKRVSAHEQQASRISSHS